MVNDREISYLQSIIQEQSKKLAIQNFFLEAYQNLIKESDSISSVRKECLRRKTITIIKEALKKAKPNEFN